MGFFTDIFNHLNDEEKESFYRTVIMNDPSEYAAKARTGICFIVTLRFGSYFDSHHFSDDKTTLRGTLAWKELPVSLFLPFPQTPFP